MKPVSFPDYKLVANILTRLTLAIFLIFLSYFSYESWKNLENAMEAQVNYINSKIETLAVPLNAFDYQITAALAEELDGLPYIDGLVVVDNFGFEIYDSLETDQGTNHFKKVEMPTGGEFMEIGSVSYNHTKPSWTSSLFTGVKRAALISVVIMLPCIAIIYYYLNRFVRIPLNRLNDAISETIQTERFVEVDYFSSSSFGQLATQFNTMQERLSKKQKRLHWALDENYESLGKMQKLTRELKKEQALREAEADIIQDILFVKNQIIIYQTDNGDIKSNIHKFTNINNDMILDFIDRPSFESDEFHQRLVALNDTVQNVSVIRPNTLVKNIAFTHHLVEMRDGSVWIVFLVQREDKFQAMVFSDYTAIYQLENSRFHNQKLESLGSLTSGVAHDFNNILTIISGAADVAQSECNGNKNLKESLDFIVSATSRARGIVSQLLTFSRAKPITRHPIDLKAFFEETKGFLQSILMAGVNLKIEIEDGLSIYENTDQLHSVVVNFAVNSREAMPNGGTFTIRARKAKPYEITMTNVKGDQGVTLIEFIDTGAGITKETQQRIFDPFFTTRSAGKGTGLGLSMAYGFAQQNGGDLKCESELGVGTTMKLFLPSVNPDKENNAPVEYTYSYEGLKDKRIYFVDDESAILNIVKLAFAREGLTVSTFNGKAEIIAAIDGGIEPCDLLITDNVMTDARAGEIIQAVHEAFGHVPTVVCSGDCDEAAKDLLDSGKANAFVQKPFTFYEMLEALGKLTV